MKHMPNLLGYTGKELKEIIALAIEMKKHPGDYSQKLKGKSMAMWFEKNSLRTRASFEIGMNQLGGYAMYLDTSTTHKKAKIEDEIKCLSKYADVIVARVYSHSTIQKMIKSSGVPVINALCDMFHPCQAMADMMTLFEVFKDPTKITLAYVGDGNNVCNSLIIAAKKLGIKINVATPAERKPNFKPDLWTTDPKKAVKNAHAVYTDTWVSMGDEGKKEELVKLLAPYQVNSKLAKDKYFMHCLPAVRGQEVTDEVIDGEKSLVFQQAENRMHVQKAILLKILT